MVVSTVRGNTVEPVGFRMRSVHVSTGDGAVLVDYAHAFRFARGTDEFEPAFHLGGGEKLRLQADAGLRPARLGSLDGALG